MESSWFGYASSIELLSSDMTTDSKFSKEQIIEIDGIKAEVVYHQAFGVAANSFIVQLPGITEVLSTRQGLKPTRLAINNYVPPELYEYVHNQSKHHKDYYKDLLKEVFDEYKVDPNESVFLSTGVSMKNLCWAKEIYQELWVITFTTAGVKNNAMSIGRDIATGIERNGQFEKIGTINNIIVSNASFDQAAMASILINATEAKNVALQELDIRSSSNKEWLATGTGTDQVIVIPGNGEHCTYVQGHTRIGEMIAKTVIDSTIGAIKKSIEDHNNTKSTQFVRRSQMAYQYKSLNKEQLEKINILENKLDRTIVALEPINLKWVDLSRDQLKEIQKLEKELGAVLGVFSHQI